MTAIEIAIQDVKRAKLALKQARERLEFELPTEVLADLHYNGTNAKIVKEYEEAMLMLLESRCGR